MISVFMSYLETISTVEAVKLYFYEFLLYISNLISNFKDFHNKILLGFSEIIPRNFSFDEFQKELLKIFSFILVINLISIVIVWKIYGKSICHRFMSHCKLTDHCIN